MWAYYRGISPRLLDRLVSMPRLALGVLALGRIPFEERRQEFAAQTADWPMDRREQALATLDMLATLREIPALAKDRDREAWGLEVLRQEGFSGADLAPEVNIEKRWRMLETALNSSVAGGKPLGYAVVGGTEVGEDLGYGSLRYLTVPEVQTAAADLAAITERELESCLQSPADQDGFSYVWEAFETVRGCYVDAAARMFGVLRHFG